MEHEKDDKINYNCIDLVKFICAILVVMIHIAPFGNSDKITIINYLNYGIQHYLARIAVPFFFVCSGFFLYKKTSLSTFNFEPTKKYALRLLKLYIIWTIIYFPLSFLSLFKDKEGIIYAVLKYIRNFIFTGSYTHLWYLTATIFAVVTISLLLKNKVKPKKIIIVAIILYIIGLFSQSWFGFIAPLKHLVPSLWSFLKIIQKIIVTSRNGLFEGIIFVGIGMLLAFNIFSISKRKSLIGFIISMILLLFEVFLLKYFRFIRENDMYLCLMPVTFFGFSYVKQIELTNNSIYIKLRHLSSLIFYSHLLVMVIVKKTLKIINVSLMNSCLLFILTLIITIIGSLIIMKLSELPKMKWLKKLY